jgi:hypothetical protein
MGAALTEGGTGMKRQAHANFVVADVSPYPDKTVLRKVLVPRHVHFDQNLDGFQR